MSTPPPNDAAQSQTAATSSEPSQVTRYTYRYHNDSLKALSVLMLGLVGLIAALGFFIFVQIVSNPRPLHFALNKNLQLIDPVPLDQEGIGTAALLNWVNEFVVKAFSYNYSNIQKQAGKLAPYFSDSALKIYDDLLATDEDFKAVILNQFVVSVVPKTAPEILVGKAFKDRYAWQIEVPVTITFSNALYRAHQDVVFDFLIWRVPETESPLGVTVVTFTHDVKTRSGIQGIRTGL
ncbi:MAG TPA: DotI/IcmL family type IV secretion protein [Gammaproteobacteria bacterium]|nr:DotI/IcmL family type IV secretion protein [Gammaproteobacteria bacterium]